MENTFFIFVLAAAFFTIASGVPTWKYAEGIDDVNPSSLEASKTDCKCGKNPHECACCLKISFHVFHKKIGASVCLNAKYTSSPLAVELSMTWNNHVLFKKTISGTKLPPICFGIPSVKAAKACAKFSKVSFQKHHTGACVSLELKVFHLRKDIRLGCFFFKGVASGGFDMEMFDRESPKLLLEDLLRSPMDLMTVEKDHHSCDCDKSLHQCVCCVQAKVIQFPVKACVHGVVDNTGTGFNISADLNGLTIIEKHVSVAKPVILCHEFSIFHSRVKICLNMNVSLTSDPMGVCFKLADISFCLGMGACFTVDVNFCLGMLLHGGPGYQEVEQEVRRRTLL